MRFRLLVSALLLCALVAGCVEKNATPGGNVQPDDSSINEELRTIEVGSQSGIREARTLVISTQATWETFWREHKSGTSLSDNDSSQPPAVDFSKERVVAVMAGQKPDSCHAMRIVDAVTQGGTTKVNAVLYTPPPDVFCAQMITYPYAIATIPARNTTVGFDIQEVSSLPPEEDEIPTVSG